MGLRFPSGLAFFGLTPDYRASLFRQIHDICFHGQGGYNFNEVYEFPIWLRNFVHRSMVEYYEKENKKNQAASGQQSILDNGKIKAPDYSVKARK
mgnify:CR=1 FL=1